MTREEFVAAYMARSEVTDWRLEGDLVIFEGCREYALPCRCREEGCEGWAMVSPTSRGWHLFMNTDDMPYDQAMKIDRKARSEARHGGLGTQREAASLGAEGG